MEGLLENESPEDLSDEDEPIERPKNREIYFQRCVILDPESQSILERPVND